MKTVILSIVLIANLQAASLTYPNGKVEYFTAEKSRSLHNRIYYRNGLINKKTTYQDSREIYVSFKTLKNLKQFSQKYQLKPIKITNQKFNTVLFKLHNSTDVLKLCSEINKNQNVRYAKPNWRAPRIIN